MPDLAVLARCKFIRTQAIRCSHTRCLCVGKARIGKASKRGAGNVGMCCRQCQWGYNSCNMVLQLSTLCSRRCACRFCCPLQAHCPHLCERFVWMHHMDARSIESFYSQVAASGRWSPVDVVRWLLCCHRAALLVPACAPWLVGWLLRACNAGRLTLHPKKTIMPCLEITQLDRRCVRLWVEARRIGAWIMEVFRTLIAELNLVVGALVNT